MKRKATRTLLVTLVLCFTLTSFVSANEIALKTKPEGDIRVQSENMVWMAYENEDWNIYYLNTTENKEINITDDSNVQGNPDVWDDYIVWQEKRGQEDFQIYLYNIKTEKKEKISEGLGRHKDPRIAENKVVWINENNSGKKVVMMYDINRRAVEQISSVDALAFGLEFDGSIAAWMDYRNERFDIYMYDVEKEEEQRLTFGLGDEVDPLVSDGKVVWTVRHNDVKQIYMYDVNKDERTRLTVGKEDHKALSFVDDSLLLIRGSELIFNNVDKIMDVSIETPTGDLPKEAFLLNEEVLWFDGESFILEETNDAISRANNSEEEVKEPDETENNTSSKKEREDNDKTLVKADEDTIITSDDKVLTLSIPKGTFNEDVHIIVHEDNLDEIEGYEILSPVYSWEIIENIKPNSPIEVTMNYELIEYMENPEKILIYVEDNGQLVPLLSERNIQDKVLKTEVINSKDVVLSAHNKNFADIKNHWAYDILDVISAQHMINGYPDGTFKPDKEMTRAEFVSILVNSGRFNEDEGLKEKNKDVDYKNNFNDVAEDFWAADAINIAYENGWVSGYNGNFNPNDSITREQMIKILMNLYEENEKLYSNVEEDNTLSQNSLAPYADKEQISSWAEEAMLKAVDVELIQGYNNKLTPLNNATRAEAATMIYKYLKITEQI